MRHVSKAEGLGVVVGLGFVFVGVLVSLLLQIVGIRFDFFFGFFYTTPDQEIRLFWVTLAITLLIFYPILRSNETFKASPFLVVGSALFTGIVTVLLLSDEQPKLSVLVLLILIYPTIFVVKTIFGALHNFKSRNVPEFVPMQNTPGEMSHVLDDLVSDALPQHWSISGKEYARNLQKSLPFLIPFVIVCPLLTLFYFDDSYSALTIFFIGVVGAFVLFLVINKLAPYRNREYTLNEQGVVLLYGKRRLFYDWEELGAFYHYTARNATNHGQISRYASASQAIQQVERRISGDIFYLLKKKKPFFNFLGKTFVVIRTIPENTETVHAFLLSKIPEYTMTDATDLGLVRYER